jgi:AcrR family transcriptional regulator
MNAAQARSAPRPASRPASASAPASRSASASTPASTAPERILSAATKCFSAHGYAGTSTRQLAAAAEVNIAALAYHFGGKEGVYQAVIDRLYQQLLALDAPLPTQGTPAWRVSLVVRAVYRFARAHQAEVRLWKLKLLTLNHLIVRYAISRDEDLVPFLSGKKDPQSKVEEHLVQVAFQLLGVED